MTWGGVGRRRLERIIHALVAQGRLELLPGKTVNHRPAHWLAPKQAGDSGAMAVSFDGDSQKEC